MLASNSNAYRPFTSLMLGHTMSYYVVVFFNEKQILPSMFSDHSGIKLKINSNEIYRGKKTCTVWKLNSTFLSNPRFKGKKIWKLEKIFQTE